MAEPVMHKGPLTLKQLLEAPRASIFELRLKQAEVLRLAGNDCLQKTLLKEALQLYDRALYHGNFEESQMKFDFKEQHQREIYDTIDPIRLNGARVSLKTGEYRRAIDYLQAVLAREKEELKPAEKTLQNAYFLMGKAQYCLSLYDEAEEALLRAREIATRLAELAQVQPEASVQKKAAGDCDVPSDVAVKGEEDKRKGEVAAITKLLNDCKIGRRDELRQEVNAWKGKLDNGNGVHLASSHPQTNNRNWPKMIATTLLICGIVAVIVSILCKLEYDE